MQSHLALCAMFVGVGVIINMCVNDERVWYSIYHMLYMSNASWPTF